MSLYADLQQSVVQGRQTEAAEITVGLLDDRVPAGDILREGLLPAMKEVGRRFEVGEFFIPEMLLAARAFNASLDLLKPHLEESDVEPVARIILGTVKGDIHDIGKNLVGIMLRGGGFEVIDAGVDVPPERFVELVEETGAELLGLSALLTTTMPSMQSTINALMEKNLRDKIKVMIGGAPVTQEYAKQIGADGYARDASAAVRVAAELAGVAG
jgi:5-methyltetrahydrofolate--homocysteine methyltransferase